MKPIMFAERTVSRIKTNSAKGKATKIGNFRYFYDWNRGQFCRISSDMNQGWMENITITEKNNI